MKYRLLAIIMLTVAFISTSNANQNKPILFSPFFDLSYDVSPHNYYYYPYPVWYSSHYDYSPHSGANLAFGLNIFRMPLYLQFQLANYLKGITDQGDYFGIAKMGMTEEITRNGFVEMNFSYTTNFLRYEQFSAFSGSVGFYHLVRPIDTLSKVNFSGGINLGFINYNYEHWDWYWWSSDRNQTEISAILEFAWLYKNFRPYIAFGLKSLVSDYYDIYPRSTGFFSIGIQACLSNAFPYFSGNQTKLTYYKQYQWYYIQPLVQNK
jgi:hypothetical protein